MSNNNMITWELAMDRYGVSEFWLYEISVTANKSICDCENRMVYNLWENKFKPATINDKGK